MKTEALELSHKISELELRIREQDDTIHFLETSVSNRDAARIKALEDLLKARGRKIQDLEIDLRSKKSEINDLEIDLDRKQHEEDDLKEDRKARSAIEVTAMREIVAALPDPARETYDQFMFRRNLRILFTALDFDELP
jgi:uncharacterized coiled-coil protein SlyX